MLLAVGMGVASDAKGLGFTTDGKAVMKARGGEGFAVLGAGADGGLTIERSPRADAAGDSAELPLLFDEKGAGPASAAHAALGITPNGRVLIARTQGEGGSAALADALRRAGCTRAVILNRGSHPAPLLARAGRENAPRNRYDESVLYAIAMPLKPRGFRFDAETAAAIPSGRR